MALTKVTESETATMFVPLVRKRKDAQPCGFEALVHHVYEATGIDKVVYAAGADEDVALEALVDELVDWVQSVLQSHAMSSAGSELLLNGGEPDKLCEGADGMAELTLHVVGAGSDAQWVCDVDIDLYPKPN